MTVKNITDANSTLTTQVVEDTNHLTYKDNDIAALTKKTTNLQSKVEDLKAIAKGGTCSIQTYTTKRE